MIVMGQITAPFAVKGWLRVRPFTQRHNALENYPSWWLDKARQWREYTVLEARSHADYLVARLQGCEDREQALALQGCHVAVPRDRLPKAGKGEHYWCDLLGLKVINVQGVCLGMLHDVMQTGANEVMCVQGARERLIPFIEGVVLKVDVKAGVLRVDWHADY
jgi:16S rRNA processing protein RimM